MCVRCIEPIGNLLTVLTKISEELEHSDGHGVLKEYCYDLDIVDLTKDSF